MAVPGWLLRIVSGFLKDRVMIMTYNGGISERKQMPGGGPAGTTLGLLMFMTLINKTANPGLKHDWGSLLTAPLRGRKPVIMTHGKQVDDASLLEAVDMEKALTAQDEEHWVRPLPRRSRYEVAIPDNLNRTSTEMTKMVEYAKANFMTINRKKTKVLLFNPKRRNIDFQPEVKVQGELLEVVEQTRLVGLIISDDLKWKANTASLVKRAYAKIWILRRLKTLGPPGRH